MGGVIEGNRGLIEVVFGGEFTKKPNGELGHPRVKQPVVKQMVRHLIDRSVQSVALFVDVNYCFVERDGIRLDVAGRLYVGLPNPVVDRSSTPYGTQYIKFLSCI